MKRPTCAKPIFALAFLAGLREVCEARGYALAVHGSLNRDFDFIVVPWRDGATSPEELAQAVAAHVGGVTRRKPHALRAHGRLGWLIYFMAGADAPYIDLSIYPPRPDASPPSPGTYDDDGA